MPRVFSATATSAGLTVKAYTGDRCAMLAFNLDDDLTDRLAGFAIRRRRADQTTWRWLGNRLDFAGAYTDAAASRGQFFSSNLAPFQKFWWVDFPEDDDAGAYRYEVVVKRFRSPDSTGLVDDQRVELEIDLGPFRDGRIELAFTRGYLSSQAYADRFHNAAFQPDQVDGWYFDSARYLDQWRWLGAHGREAIVDFLNACHADRESVLDAFVYDLNEPDVIRALCVLASEGRLRLLADDTRAMHGEGTAAGTAFDAIVQAAPAAQRAALKRGHFGRYQHNKVFIRRRGALAQSVLTGSTNFSITGLYVNANHVLVFNDEQVAAQYETAFQTAFDGELKRKSFAEAPIALAPVELKRPGLPTLQLSFAPHAKPTFSLQPLLKAIEGARSSVIFAVMQLTGKGAALAALSNLHTDPKIFSYGIADTLAADENTVDGTRVYSSTRSGDLVYSKEDPEVFPPPFASERQVHGPAAHVVHHKFVVVDFNGEDPVVFCGSSNLAEGGEEANGDNLIAIHDRALATAFAIEGIRLVDHYAFAAALKRIEKSGRKPEPLRLKTDHERWYRPYYEEGNIRRTERLLFTRPDPEGNDLNDGSEGRDGNGEAA